MAGMEGLLVFVVLLMLVAPLVLFWLITQEKEQSNVMDRQAGERAARRDIPDEDDVNRPRDRERR